MKSYIGVTDFDWFDFLSKLNDLDEVNFWQPSGNRVFNVLKTGEIFLFKLHSPRNFIVGGGIFAHSSILPASLAWESFQERNGAPSFEEMRRRIEKYRRISTPKTEDYKVGCVILEEPFFFEENEWIPIPQDWKANIVQGKTYNLEEGHGKILWRKLEPAIHLAYVRENLDPRRTARFGSAVTILPRLGQGSFRVLVTDAYKRRCAVTAERTLPALEAAHIKPYKEEGPHEIPNGILLRSDIHRLFDKGYVTVTTDYHFEVSKRIREEFENGREYYALRGRAIYVPEPSALRPAKNYLIWHNEKVFLG